MIVRHAAGSYEISFTALAEAVAALPSDCVIVTDRQVHRLYAHAIGDRPTVIVPPGEPSKSVATWAEVQSQLATRRARRATTLVAFGGGVIGDLAGFVAATYMRGVPLVQLPTTLLAQVDSSVGGKVGIDLPEGKNLVGAFYPPQHVFICDEVLDTLPEREWRNGMAEVWKYGFILDKELCDRLRGMQKNTDRHEIVRRCIELKAAAVEADEFETTGERAKLNFGHTVGHAIEKIAGYGKVLHGEAISIGMVAEAAIGEALDITQKGTREAVEQSLQSEGLPTTSLVLKDVDMLIAAMRGDKKATPGGLAFSLLTRVGDCKLVRDVPEAQVRAVLASL